MDFDVIVALAQLIGLIVVAVWATSKIRSATEILGVKVDHLTTALTSLDSTVGNLRSELSSVRERVAVLERRTDDCPAVADYVRGRP